jgi:hypothetical protein
MGLGRDRRDGHPDRQQQQPDPRQAVEPAQHRWSRAMRQRQCELAPSRAGDVLRTYKSRALSTSGSTNSR